MRKLLYVLLALVMGALLAGHFLRADDASDGDYKKRRKVALDILQRQPARWEDFETAARALIRDFPDKLNGYEDMMILVEHYEAKAIDRQRAAALAKEMDADTTPQKFRLWAKGCLNRLNAAGKPIDIQFTAVDGTDVDVAKMKGKVVLIDFWATTCSPCVAELPEIKAAYDKYHTNGFEVIGISCDAAQQTDQSDLEKFIKRKALPWPQYYDGHQQTDNKFAQQFGIDGIPHLMLVDKKGNLRFDNVQRKDLDKKIGDLLAE
jgi:peroxiredoxin